MNPIRRLSLVIRQKLPTTSPNSRTTASSNRMVARNVLIVQYDEIDIDLPIGYHSPDVAPA